MSVLKIVAIIAVVVLVVIILNYLFKDNHTLSKVVDAKQMTEIPSSDLEQNDEIPSSNFAYSVWFYINDWNYKYGKEKIIFGRMGAPTTTPVTGELSGVNPCPVVSLGKIENNITVSIGCYPGTTDASAPADTTNTVVHSCTLNNVPIQRWVNLVMSVYGRTVDLYLNGKLVKTCLLPGVASVNSKSKLYLTPMGGFDGWTSKLQYYADSLNPQDAWNIYSKGYSSWFKTFNSYQLEISLVENGTEQGTVVI